ncbi:MAG: hypothetical protein ACKN82_03675, partial [Pirellula sp.]
GVVAVFLGRYGNGILTYSEESIEMFVRLSAEELLSQAYREYVGEVEQAISRYQAEKTQRRLSVTPTSLEAEPLGPHAQAQAQPLAPAPAQAVAAVPTSSANSTVDLPDPDPLSSVATASLAVSSALRKSLIAAGLSSAKEVLDFHIAKGLASLDGIGTTSEQYILDAIASLTDQQSSNPTPLVSGDLGQATQEV